jgi:hypothetical protein
VIFGCVASSMTAGSCQSDTRQSSAEAWRKSRAER